jgi:hypothetical protein
MSFAIFVVIPFIDPISGIIKVLTSNIAYRDSPNLRKIHETAQITAALIAHADKAHIDAVVGTEGF